MQDINKAFITALNALFLMFPRGSKKTLAEAIHVSTGHFSDILNGRRGTSEEKRREICYFIQNNYLTSNDFNYFDILAYGQAILEQHPSVMIVSNALNTKTKAKYEDLLNEWHKFIDEFDADDYDQNIYIVRDEQYRSRINKLNEAEIPTSSEKTLTESLNENDPLTTTAVQTVLEGETVTVSREEYEALKGAATRQDHEGLSLGQTPLYGVDLGDIKQLLMTIVATTLGQVEATRQADSDIIKAIKQNKIEEYEKALAHLRQDLKEKNQQIENLESDQNRLKTQVEVKVDNMFTLVGGKKDDNGGDDNGGNGNGGGEKVA